MFACLAKSFYRSVYFFDRSLPIETKIFLSSAYDEQSPAGQSGYIRIGDLVLEIGGQPVRAMNIRQLTDCFASAPGDELLLKIMTAAEVPPPTKVI